MIEYFVFRNKGEIVKCKIDIVPMKYKSLDYGIRHSLLDGQYYLFDLQTGRMLGKNEDKKYLLSHIETLYHMYESFVANQKDLYNSYILDFENAKVFKPPIEEDND